MATFILDTVDVTPTRRTPSATVDEAYRPIFDAVSALEGERAVKVTLDTTTIADAAKSTVQVLARQAGFTARERRGSRVTHKDGTVTLEFVKRPAQGKRASATGDAGESIARRPAGKRRA